MGHGRGKKYLVAVSVGLLLLAAVLFVYFSGSRISKRNYKRIENGMTVLEVEALLGPGTEVEKKCIPKTTGMIPVVKGDRFYRWEDMEAGTEIFIGLKDNVVCDKWYWEVSF